MWNQHNNIILYNVPKESKAIIDGITISEPCHYSTVLIIANGNLLRVPWLLHMYTLYTPSHGQYGMQVASMHWSMSAHRCIQWFTEVCQHTGVYSNTPKYVGTQVHTVIMSWSYVHHFLELAMLCLHGWFTNVMTLHYWLTFYCAIQKRNQILRKLSYKHSNMVVSVKNNYADIIQHNIIFHTSI